MRIIISILLLITAPALFADTIYLKNGGTVNGRILRVTAYNIEYAPEDGKPFNMLKLDEAEKIVFDGGGEVIISDKAPEENAGRADENIPLSLADGRIVPYSGNRKITAYGLSDSRFSRSYWVAGVCLGNPGLHNLMLGYYGENFGGHVSGMLYFTDNSQSFFGTRLNLIAKLYETKETLFSISAALGYLYGRRYYEDDYYDYYEADRENGTYKKFSSEYAGISLLLNRKGFHLEAGLAWKPEANGLSGYGSYLLPLSGYKVYPLFQIGYLKRMNGI